MTRYVQFRTEELRAMFRDGGSETGQALAELCIGLSLMVLLLLGAVDFGQVAYTSIAVSNAAKAGVQYGAESGVTPQNATGMCAANDKPGIQNAVQNAAPRLTGITSSTALSFVCSDGTAATGLNTDCTNTHVEETLQVSTSYTLTPMIRWPLLPSTFTVKGQATQECGN